MKLLKSLICLAVVLTSSSAIAACRYEWNGSEYIWVCDSDPIPDPTNPTPNPSPTCEYELHCGTSGCEYVWVCD